jgi:hypothetical protein
MRSVFCVAHASRQALASLEGDFPSLRALTKVIRFE